jgi:hypothetical protein
LHLEERGNYSTLNGKRKGFDNFLLMFHNQFLSASKKGHNHILALEFFPNEVGGTIGLNSAMRVNFANERNLSSCNREMKMTSGILVGIQVKPLRQMSKRPPEPISKNPRESCAMFVFGKSPLGLLIMVVLQKSFVGSSQCIQRRAFMPVQDSFLPQAVKTLYRGIPPRFSLGDEDQVGPHQQMETNYLGETVRITPPSFRHPPPHPL